MIGLGTCGCRFSDPSEDENNNINTKNIHKHSQSDEILSAFETVLSEIERRSYEVISLPNWIYLYCTPAGRRFMHSVKKLETWVINLIKARRKVKEERKKKDTMTTQSKDTPDESEDADTPKADLLDLIMDATDEDGSQFTDKQIQEEITTFLVRLCV